MGQFRNKGDVVEKTDRLLNVREAADLLGLRPKTLYLMAGERRIASVKILGKSLRFRESAIRQIIEDGEVSAKEPRH